MPHPNAPNPRKSAKRGNLQALLLLRSELFFKCKGSPDIFLSLVQQIRIGMTIVILQNEETEAREWVAPEFIHRISALPTIPFPLILLDSSPSLNYK